MLRTFTTTIDRLPRQLKLVRELEAFEGPILSEYRAKDGGVYLEKWCAREGTTTRWLLVRSMERPIAEYLGGTLSMLDLLVRYSDGVGFIVDRELGEITRTFYVSLAEVDEYLPKPTAMHDESLRPDWDTIPQSFLLNADWDAPLLSEIERVYLNATSFGHCTAPNSQAPFPSGLLAFNMDGGIPVVHIFRQLRGSLPKAHRPRSASVYAASPGVLTIDAPAAGVHRLMTVLTMLPAAQPHYQALHSWAKLRPRNVDQVPGIAKQHIETLCKLLNVEPTKLLPANIAASEEKGALLVAGKLIAAYYRMLRRVAKPRDGVVFTGVGGAPAVSTSDDVDDADDDEQEDLDDDDDED